MFSTLIRGGENHSSLRFIWIRNPHLSFIQKIPAINFRCLEMDFEWYNDTCCRCSASIGPISWFGQAKTSNFTTRWPTWCPISNPFFFLIIVTTIVNRCNVKRILITAKRLTNQDRSFSIAFVYGWDGTCADIIIPAEAQPLEIPSDETA